MGKCYVRTCRHRIEQKSCKFFKLPKSPRLRAKWLIGVERHDDGNEPSSSACVCSCHFPDSSRDRTPKVQLSSAEKSKRTPKMRSTGALPDSVNSRKKARRCLMLGSADTVGTVGVEQEEPTLQRCESDDLKPLSVPTLTLPAISPGFIKRHPTTPSVSDVQFEESFGNCNNDDSLGELSTGPLDTTSGNLKTNISVEEQLDRLRNEKEELESSFYSLSAETVVNKQFLDNVIQERDSLLLERNMLQQEKDTLIQDRNALRMENEALRILKRLEEDTLHCYVTEAKKWELKCEEVGLELANTFGFGNTVLNELNSLKSTFKNNTQSLESCKERYAKAVAETETLSKKVKFMNEETSKAKEELKVLCKVVSALKSEKADLKKKLTAVSTRLRFEYVCSDDNISHYTGIPNVNTFYWLLSMIPENVNYYFKSKVTCLDMRNQLFLTLYKLRRNPSHEVLSNWFGVGTFVVSNVILTFINLLHIILVQGMMKEVPPLSKMQGSMPKAFEKYPNCRMILDCTEITVQVPTLMKLHNLVHSNYKKRTTFKGLLGIAPNGATVFASKLFPGSNHDRTVVINSGVLDIFNRGDAVMADKGFTIKDLLPPGVELNLPPFRDTAQFTQGQILETLEIARARIHVERAIQRVKLFHILDLLPHYLFRFASDIFQVCAALCNLMHPLIKEVEDIMRSQISG